jgi:hypothetical protein
MERLGDGREIEEQVVTLAWIDPKEREFAISEKKFGVYGPS